MKYKTLLTLSAAFFACSAAFGQQSLQGHWEGVAKHGGAETEIALDIETDGEETKVFVTCRSAGVLRGPMGAVSFSEGVLRAESRPGSLDYSITVQPGGDGVMLGALQTEDFTADLRLEKAEWDPPYSVEAVTFEGDGVQLNGAIYMPEGPGPFPAIVHLHGSGDGYISDFTYWADFFARMGIASLVYDKRGCGGSAGDWRDVGFEPLARDGVAAVNIMKARRDIDASRIGMTGISQAGWLMPLAASMTPDVSFLVIISGPPITVEEEGYYDYLVKLKDAGYSEDIIAQARDMLEMDRQVVRTGEGEERLRDRVREVRKEPWYRDMGFVRSPHGGWYAKIVDYDPLPTLKKVNIPILWVYGMADKSVPPERSIAILEELKVNAGKDYTIVKIPNANHGIRVPADNSVAVPFNVYPNAYPSAVSDWLKRRVLGE